MKDSTSAVWQDYAQSSAAQKMCMLKSGNLTISNKTMKFEYFPKGQKPQQGYMLIFGFHGGGGCPAEANDQQFNNHKHLYDQQLPKGCIWFVPRSIENVSDMWHRPYLQDFLLQIISAFTTNGIVDPNRVFISGYSAGGDGVYHMAPRMADWLAGAAMMAGHPNKVSLMNVRNIAFSIQVGGDDQAYNRNKEASKYIQSVNQLKSNYGGYEQKSMVHVGKSHWMDKKDTDVFNWLFSHTRNPYPDIILFKQHPHRPKSLFYYIRLEDLPQKIEGHNNDEETVVIKEGNCFNIISNRVVTILLNTRMIDPNQPISILHNGVSTITGALMNCRYDVMTKTLKERKDPFYIFQDEFTSVPPKKLTREGFIAGLCHFFGISELEKRLEYLPSQSLGRNRDEEIRKQLQENQPKNYLPQNTSNSQSINYDQNEHFHDIKPNTGFQLPNHPQNASKPLNSSKPMNPYKRLGSSKKDDCSVF